MSFCMYENRHSRLSRRNSDNLIRYEWIHDWKCECDISDTRKTASSPTASSALFHILVSATHTATSIPLRSVVQNKTQSLPLQTIVCKPKSRAYNASYPPPHRATYFSNGKIRQQHFRSSPSIIWPSAFTSREDCTLLPRYNSDTQRMNRPLLTLCKCIQVSTCPA